VLRAGNYQQAVILVRSNGGEVLKELIERYIEVPEIYAAEYFAAAFEEYRCQGDSITLLRLYHLNPSKNLRSQILSKFSRELYVIVDRKEDIERRSLAFGDLIHLGKAAADASKSGVQAAAKASKAGVQAAAKRGVDACVRACRTVSSGKGSVGKKDPDEKEDHGDCKEYRIDVPNAALSDEDPTVEIGHECESEESPRPQKSPDNDCGGQEGGIAGLIGSKDDEEDLPPLHERPEVERRREDVKKRFQPRRARRKFRMAKGSEAVVSDPLLKETVRQGAKKVAKKARPSTAALTAPILKSNEDIDKHVWYYRGVILAELEYHNLSSDLLSPAVLHSEMYQNAWLNAKHVRLMEEKLLEIRKKWPEAQIAGIKSALKTGWYYFCYYKYLQVTVRYDTNPDSGAPVNNIVLIRIPDAWSYCCCFTCFECVTHCGGLTCLGELVVEYWAIRTRWYYWVVGTLEILWGFAYGACVAVSTVLAANSVGISAEKTGCDFEDAEIAMTLLILYWALHFYTFGLGMCLDGEDGFKLAFRLCCPMAYPFQIFRDSHFFGQVDPKRAEMEEVEYVCDVDVNAATVALKAARRKSSIQAERKKIGEVIKTLKEQRKLDGSDVQQSSLNAHRISV